MRSVVYVLVETRSLTQNYAEVEVYARKVLVQALVNRALKNTPIPHTEVFEWLFKDRPDLDGVTVGTQLPLLEGQSSPFYFELKWCRRNESLVCVGSLRTSTVHRNYHEALCDNGRVTARKGSIIPQAPVPEPALGTAEDFRFRPTYVTRIERPIVDTTLDRLAGSLVDALGDNNQITSFGRWLGLMVKNDRDIETVRRTTSIVTTDGILVSLATAPDGDRWAYHIQVSDDTNTDMDTETGMTGYEITREVAEQIVSLIRKMIFARRTAMGQQ